MATADEFPYVELIGEKIKLKPINVAEDIEELYKNSHGDATLESLWEYLPYGPFSSLEAMRAKYQKDLIPASRLYVVIDLATNQKIGLMQFINISPEHKRVEIGGTSKILYNVLLTRHPGWYTPRFHRTYANTESCYLLLKYAFDTLKYRRYESINLTGELTLATRVEWKCNNDNKKSFNAALGLGFSFEGVFRQHMLLKGKNRDSAWFSVIDSEWETVKKKLLGRLEKYNQPVQ